ncbi:MAG: BatA domain-containing protein [Pirellulaceae bacterium]|nr:BatA domain-containing protein [Pirellulaceae bacterium]
MWGLSFIHTGFVVAGVAAAGLPVLIHMLMRQRTRNMPIGSVRFLKVVLREHTRRRRIRQWLLLALRTLAVLLLALLFARPFLDYMAQAGLDQQVLVLLDRSASMQAADTGLTAAGRNTLFATALRTAQGELLKLDEQTEVSVGLFDAGGVQTVPVEQLDRSLAPSEVATDYGAALAWARDLIVSSPRPRQRVILVTDLQRSGLHRTPLADFPEHAELVIHDVGRTISQNVAIEQCGPARSEIRPGEPVRITARIYNGGALPLRNLPVELALRGPGGVLSQRRNVTLLGGARETVEFELPEIQADGMYEGSVAVQHGDDLPIDNRRWLAFEARHPDRLLLVDGQQGRSVYANETYYLEKALRLRPSAQEGPSRSFEIERIVWEDGDGFPGLDGFRAIVLCNVARLTPTDGQRLREYVESGGNLLLFGGDQMSPAVFETLRDAGLVTGRMVRDPVRGLMRCRNWDPRHAIFLPFADPQRGDLRRLGFEQLLEVRDLAPTTKVLIEAGPYPLMLEQPLGEGTVLLVTTAADRAWSDWPQSRLYVPLVRQMLAYLTDQLAGRQTVVSELVEQPGARAGITADGERRLVRNVDPRESVLDRVAEEEFREQLGLGPPTLEQLTAGLELPRDVSRPSEIWTGLMWALLAVLVAETLLGSRVHA